MESQTAQTYDWYVEVKKFYASKEVPPSGETPSAEPTKRQMIPITQRMIYLFRPADQPWSTLWARYARIFQVHRGGQVHYSLAVRKEVFRPWWDKVTEPTISTEYTAVRQLNRIELIALLRHWIGSDAERAVETMETMPPPNRGRN